MAPTWLPSSPDARTCWHASWNWKPGGPPLTEGVDEDLLDRYNRLFKSKGGIALVTVEHGVCTGCHMQVNTQTVLEVRAEKEIIGCPQCGRILYEPQ